MNNILKDTEKRFKNVAELDDYLGKQNFQDRKIKFKDLDFRNGRLLGMPVKQTGADTLLQRVGIPKLYANKIPQDLLDYNINRLFKEDGDKKVLVRFQNDQVRAVLSDTYKPIDDRIVVNQIQKGLNGHKTTNVIWTDRFSRVSIVDNNKPIEVKVGDTWLGGVDILNSGTGFHAFLSQRYLLRLVCSNGMVSKEAVGGNRRRIHRGNPILRYRNDIRYSLQNMGNYNSDKLIALTQAKVDHAYLGKVERLLVPVFGTEGAKKFREGNLTPRKTPTKYDVIDVVTCQAHQYEAEEFSKQRELETVGGELIRLAA